MDLGGQPLFASLLQETSGSGLRSKGQSHWISLHYVAYILIELTEPMFLGSREREGGLGISTPSAANPNYCL
jgi:hypothetical protein